MSITGNLKTMQLAELLQWLAQSKKTGTLVIDDGRVTKRIFFRSGRIISSASTDPKEHLGHFLVSHGLITEQELAKAVEMQERTKMLLGKILVTIGAIEEQVLHRLLRLKAEESLYDLFTWATGEFRFHDGELPSEHDDSHRPRHHRGDPRGVSPDRRVEAHPRGDPVHAGHPGVAHQPRRSEAAAGGAAGPASWSTTTGRSRRSASRPTPASTSSAGCCSTSSSSAPQGGEAAVGRGAARDRRRRRPAAEPAVDAQRADHRGGDAHGGRSLRDTPSAICARRAASSRRTATSRPRSRRRRRRSAAGWRRVASR